MKFCEIPGISVESSKKHKNLVLRGPGQESGPGTIKMLWITAVFTCQRKGAVFLEIHGILEISWISWFLWKIMKFREITWKIRKSSFFTNPRPFTKRLFFLGQIDGPAPWDPQNLKITRIPWNFMKFHDFNEIMLNFGDCSRILV